MHHTEESMPMTHDYMKKMLDRCTEEWLNTREGQQYKAQYEKLKRDMESVKKSMDAHIHQHMQSKYGMM